MKSIENKIFGRSYKKMTDEFLDKLIDYFLKQKIQ